MKPAPAISTFSTQGEWGSASTMSLATSRGLRFMGLASCIATLQAKSPWEACLAGASSMLGLASGATTLRASDTSWLRWVFRSDMIQTQGETAIIRPEAAPDTLRQPRARGQESKRPQRLA